MKDIRKIFHHCVAVNIFDDGRIVPTRFTEKRLGVYAQTPRAPYSLCPSGVTMEFITDADKISFDYVMSPAQKDYITSDIFDVYENDEFTEVLRPATYVGRIVYRKKNAGKTKIRIHLPIGVLVSLSNIELGDYEPIKEEKKKLLIMGDSISQGLFGVNPSKSYIPMLAYKNDFDYLNASVGGDIYSKSDIDIENGFMPDAILCERGTNDMVFIKDEETIVNNARDMLLGLKESYKNIPILVISCFWTGFFEKECSCEKAYTLEQMVRITKKVKEICEGNDIIFLDGMDLIPHNDEYFADVCHPNDKGFEKLAEAVEPMVKNVLRIG